MAISFSGTGLKQSGKFKNKTTDFQKFLFFLLSRNYIFILCKNGKITGNKQSVSRGAAATLVAITDPMWGTEEGSHPTPVSHEGTVPLHQEGCLQQALPTSKPVLIWFVIAVESQQPRHQRRLFKRHWGESQMVTRGPA